MVWEVLKKTHIWQLRKSVPQSTKKRLQYRAQIGPDTIKIVIKKVSTTFCHFWIQFGSILDPILAPEADKFLRCAGDFVH